MKRTSSTALLIAAYVMTIAPSAFAGGKKPHPGPSDSGITGEQTQLQGQLQGQLQAQGQDQQQAAIAGAGAESKSQSAAASHATGGAGGNSGGNTLATSYESRDRAIALALPGQTGAPAVAGECLEHLRGGSGASIGVSGRTRINRECMEFVQCIAIADRYAQWGQLQLAVEQLEACGGVEDAVIATTPAVAEATGVDFITRAEFERAWIDLNSK